jgi:glycosyltransferase involved in cell wall biosynthesis
MRICIDVSQAVYGTGVGDYTKSLVSEVLKLNRQNEYVLFGGTLRRRADLKNLFPQLENSTLKTAVFPPTIADIFWNKLHQLPIEKFVGDVDLYHSSDWAQAPSKAYKVTTIHDLAPLRFPQYTPRKIVEAHRGRLKWVVKEVDKIIAVSSFTKQEAVELLKIDPDRIVVIPEAGDANIQKASSSAILEALQKFNVYGKYLLVVGTNPRKNVPRIISAFDKIKNQLSLTTLVVTGKRPGNAEDRADVVYTGFVSASEMSALFSGAEALVYASLYEGFGQPILEAMKCEVPVVSSNTSSMPEVAGSAAVLVNPTNVSEIADGIIEALKNRDKWVGRGLERVKEFSWTDTAKLTFRVYREAVK